MTFKTSSKRCAEIDAASKAEENLMSGITHPGLHDCLCGRGGHATNHPGNVQFRMLVSKYKDYYMGLSRYGKLQVAAEVVKLWRSQTPAGRFLAMTDPSNRENTTWHDIGDKEAIKKTSQCLRERIPPHQKARTLEMVTSKKSKPSDRSKSQNNGHALTKGQEESGSQMGSDHSSRNVQNRNGQWPDITEQMAKLEEYQPRPILESAVVSLTSTPASPHLKVKKEISVTGMPRLDPLEPVRSTSPVPLRQNNSHHSREVSWATNSGSNASMSTEDFAWMAAALNDDPEPSTCSSGNDMNDTNNHQTSGSDQVNGALIPSAANLTMDVFDEEIYRPLINGTTKTFGAQDGASSAASNPYNAQPAPTTLNQSLSSNFYNIFSL